MVNIINNRLTNQGDINSDVESNFTLEHVLNKSIPSIKLRALVANDDYCQKVVNLLCSEMSNVKFDLNYSVYKRSRNIKSDIDRIHSELESLIPWFAEAQKEANIVGKSYLIFDVNYAREIESPYNNFPLTIDIDWEENKYGITSLKPLKVVSCDRYFWDKREKYLLQRSNQSSNAVTAKDLSIDFVEDWVLNNSDEDEEKIEELQFEIINNSHVIEFTAFDYQDDSDIFYRYDRNLSVSLRNRKYIDCEYGGDTGVSFRLIRFLPSLLRYLSFLNATLNRMHRSEAIVYKKEDLGELNQALARYVSNNSDNALVPDITDLIKQELTTLQNSLRNFGIAQIDKRHDIEMLSRNLSGLKDLESCFSRDLIAASHLTEFTLFGTTNAGSGLSSLDVRDRAAIAKQTDNLFVNHWVPSLTHIAKSLAKISPNIQLESHHNIYIVNHESFKLSQLESSEWLQKRIDVLLDLLKEKVIDREIVLKEISSNNSIGKYFNIDDADVTRLLSSNE